MKRDEPFDPSIKSKKFPEGLIFRIVNRQDCDSINNLTSERNPFQSMKEIKDGTTVRLNEWNQVQVTNYM